MLQNEMFLVRLNFNNLSAFLVEVANLSSKLALWWGHFSQWLRTAGGPLKCWQSLCSCHQRVFAYCSSCSLVSNYGRRGTWEAPLGRAVLINKKFGNSEYPPDILMATHRKNTGPWCFVICGSLSSCGWGCYPGFCSLRFTLTHWPNVNNQFY